MAEVWAIATNKGGVLKTSITVNLAGLLSKEGNVLIIDTDSQGNSSLAFGKNPDNYENTLYDVLINDLSVEKAIYNLYENIDILPANDELAFFETDVLKDRDNKYPNPLILLKDAADSLRADYDFILVDSPPSISLISDNVLTFVDRVIIPFQPETFSQRSLTKIIKLIEDFKVNINPNLSILGVVSTLVDSRTNVHKEIMISVENYCKQQEINYFEAFIKRSIAQATSVAYDNMPSTLRRPKQPQVKDYEELLNEINTIIGGNHND